MPISAAGYYRLGGDLKLIPHSDSAILDGVILLHLATKDQELTPY
jgi:hypothetical protein